MMKIYELLLRETQIFALSTDALNSLHLKFYIELNFFKAGIAFSECLHQISSALILHFLGPYITFQALTLDLQSRGVFTTSSAS